MSAQPQPGDPVGELAVTLQREVVEPIFAALPPRPSSSTLPPVLLRSRRERAKARIAEALAWRGKATVPAKLRAEVQWLVERWAEASFEDAFRDVEEFAIRCADEHEQRVAKQSGGDGGRDAAERALRREIERVYGVIEIRGLQTSARVLQSMDLAYVPLFVEDGSQPVETVKIAEGIEARRVPREPVTDVVARHERVVIVGAPGSGKTTLMSYLALRAAAEGTGRTVPFVVPVRSLAGRPLDEDTVASLAGCEPVLVRRALAERRALVLIDGLDEIAGGAGALVPALRRLAEANPGNRFVATSRPPAGVNGGTVEVPGFAPTRLQPMTRDEVYDFIDKWCRAAERSLQKDARRADEDAQKAADDLKERVRRSRPVERLAETPLMCSVLCIVHRFLGQRIPERRAALYEACTNVLLYEWDRAKFTDGALVGRLDAQQKRTLLAGIAVAMHRERLAEVSAERAVELMSERLGRVGRPSGEALGILGEIRDRSGLLVERRPGFFGFSHLTFQEYLTAFELAGSEKGVHELVSHCAEPWWHEVIALGAGMAGPRAALLVGELLASDGDVVGMSTMLAAHCLETAVELPVPLRREVEARIAKLVPPRFDQDMKRLHDLGEVSGPVLLRVIDGASGDQKARALRTLGSLHYEPSVAALVRSLKDHSRTTEEIPPIHVGVVFGAGVPVALVAASALTELSISSDVARRRLLEVAPDHPELFRWMDPDDGAYFGLNFADSNAASVDRLRVDLLRALKSAHPRKPPSKRAARSG